MRKLLFVLLLLAITAQSWGRIQFRDRYTTLVNDTVVSNFDGGVGTEWVRAAGDSVVNDLVNYQNGTKSIALYSSNNVATSAYKTINAGINLSSRTNIIVNIFMPYANINHTDWSGGTGKIGIRLALSSNSYFYQVDLRQIYSLDGWYKVSLNYKSFLVVGTPRLDSIVKITVSVNSLAGLATSVTFDRLEICNPPQPLGAVIFNIDDNFATAFDYAKPIFDRYGITGSLFINPSTVGVGDKMSLQNVSDFQTSGWDVCSHNYYHVNDTTYSLDSLTKNITAAKTYLRNNELRGYDIYAPPYGNHNHATDSVVGLYHSFGRGPSTVFYKWGSNTYNSAYPTPIFSGRFILPVFTFAGTGLDSLKRIADSAVATKTTAAYLFHRFAIAGGGTSTTIDTARLDSLLSYIHGLILANTLSTGTKISNFLLPASDSIVTQKAVSKTATTYTPSCSLSTDMYDSAKAFLYDSSAATTWTARDSTGLLPRGALFTLTRSGATAGTVYKYTIIARNNSGTYDSSFAAQNVTTLSTSGVGAPHRGSWRFGFGAWLGRVFR